jgi:hypothetical protein
VDGIDVSPRACTQLSATFAGRSVSRASGDVPLGIRGSEVRLAEALHGYGPKNVATDYLNAGSGVLREAAEERARRNNYRILHMGGHANVTWGQF